MNVRRQFSSRAAAVVGDLRSGLKGTNGVNLEISIYSEDEREEEDVTKSEDSARPLLLLVSCWSSSHASQALVLITSQCLPTPFLIHGFNKLGRSFQ